MADFLSSIAAWFASTHLQEQIKDVDFPGLFTNPWFLVPFITLVGYLLFKQAWKDVVILGLLTAVWWFTGTDYMSSLLVDGEIQINKILPVVFGGAAVLGVIIYLLFGRSD